MAHEMAPQAALALFDRELEELSLEGHWNMRLPKFIEPQSKLRPMHWPWSTLREKLLRAGDLISVDEAGRRTVRLLNPGLLPRRSTTHTLHMSLQLILPGEVAAAHRHTAAAVRFVVEGSGAYTTVEGDSFLLEPGDFVLTPNWTWHDHLNESEGPIIWIDGLDMPLVQGLDALFLEQYERSQQPVQRVVSTAEDGVQASRKRGAAWYFKWAETEGALRRMAGRPELADEDIVLVYAGKNGGPTLPTFNCGSHMLRPGERTKTRRRTSAGIFHVVRGSGASYVGETVFEWERGDCFVVPNWTWHRHQNRSSDEAALLYFMSDRPVLEAFGLYREERQD